MDCKDLVVGDIVIVKMGDKVGIKETLCIIKHFVLSGRYRLSWMVSIRHFRRAREFTVDKNLGVYRISGWPDIRPDAGELEELKLIWELIGYPARKTLHGIFLLENLGLH